MALQERSVINSPALKAFLSDAAFLFITRAAVYYVGLPMYVGKRDLRPGFMSKAAHGLARSATLLPG